MDWEENKTPHLKMQKWILLMFSWRLVKSHHTAVFRDTQTVGVSAACNYPTVESDIEPASVGHDEPTWTWTCHQQHRDSRVYPRSPSHWPTHIQHRRARVLGRLLSSQQVFFLFFLSFFSFKAALALNNLQILIIRVRSRAPGNTNKMLHSHLWRVQGVQR